MFPLTDEIEKEEKIDPQSINEMPKNRAQGEAQMIFARIPHIDIPVQTPYQHNDPGKNMQEVRSGDDIQK